MNAATDITGVILAGGQGRRFGGQDKGWLPCAGQPLIQQVLAQLQPQVSTVLINANRHHAQYAALGVPVFTDKVADQYDNFPGPLAGIAAGLAAATTEWVLFVPCDAPILPTDLAQRLFTATATAEIAVASAGGRPQYVCALIPQRLWHDAHTFLTAGEQRMQDWFAQYSVQAVRFENVILNVNTPAELLAAEQSMQGMATQ